jgi:hypothetical protein
MKESEVWQIVKAGLEGQQVLCQRIESATTNSGIFDVNCTWAGIEFWLELKAESRPLRPAQKAWGVEKARVGARVSILNMDDSEFVQLWSVYTGIIKGQYPAVADKIFNVKLGWFQVRQYLTMHP